MASSARLLLTIQLFYNWCINSKQVDSEVVCLYDEWALPIESIDSKERLFELIPLSNSNEKTENNIMLHLYTDECSGSLSHPFFGGAHYQTGPSVLHLASLNYKNIYPKILDDWNLNKNCSLFVFIPIDKTYNNYESFNTLTDQSWQSFTRYIHDNRVAQADFINNYGKDVKFFWYEKHPRYLDIVKNGATRTEHTFLGHIFKAIDANDDSFIDLYLIDGHRTKSITRDPMYEWCRASGIDCNKDLNTCIHAYEEEMIDWAYKFWTRKREALNYVQPKIVPNFTEIGFKKIHLPDDVYGPIKKFWDEKYNANDFAEEGYAGPVLNQYTSPTFMAHLQTNERNILIQFFRNVLSEWAGLNDPSKLKMTSLYGIRKYERDAVLAMHVDTCKTHVISAIVNVDSSLDSGKDWPLQIYDHQDNLHELTMIPGDAVFYESAKCGHSRRKPLPGDYYANLFIHYRPSGEWNFDWF